MDHRTFRASFKKQIQLMYIISVAFLLLLQQGCGDLLSLIEEADALNTAVKNVSAEAGEDEGLVTISWNAHVSDLVEEYNIYRTFEPFTENHGLLPQAAFMILADDETFLGVTTETQYTDEVSAHGIYSYFVYGVLDNGLETLSSQEATYQYGEAATSTSDTTVTGTTPGQTDDGDSVVGSWYTPELEDELGVSLRTQFNEDGSFYTYLGLSGLDQYDSGVCHLAQDSGTYDINGDFLDMSPTGCELASGVDPEDIDCSDEAYSYAYEFIDDAFYLEGFLLEEDLLDNDSIEVCDLEDEDTLEAYNAIFSYDYEGEICELDTHEEEEETNGFIELAFDGESLSENAYNSADVYDWDTYKVELEAGYYYLTVVDSDQDIPISYADVYVYVGDDAWDYYDDDDNPYGSGNLSYAFEVPTSDSYYFETYVETNNFTACVPYTFNLESISETEFETLREDNSDGRPTYCENDTEEDEEYEEGVVTLDFDGNSFEQDYVMSNMYGDYADYFQTSLEPGDYLISVEVADGYTVGNLSVDTYRIEEEGYSSVRSIEGSDSIISYTFTVESTGDYDIDVLLYTSDGDECVSYTLSLSKEDS